MSTPRCTGRRAAHPEQIRERLSVLHLAVAESLESQFGSTLFDLQQLRNMLGDATGKLSQAFQLMVRQAREQGELAGRLRAETDAPIAREIEELAGEISKGAMLVVQSLQFEDMANQLLQHVDKRIDWLGNFARDASLLRTAVREDMVRDELRRVSRGGGTTRRAAHAARPVGSQGGAAAVARRRRHRTLLADVRSRSRTTELV
ncbi:MAG: hypothetical protein IPK33_10910 [Gemmatimonadetes bacterium]|nr:hypothetical protein [Gemmatimonadota bacterium]